MDRLGFFVTLEGIEGAGKSTLLPHLAQVAESLGWEVVCTREPGGGPLGEALRGIFLDPSLPLDASEELLLLYAGRHNHLRQRILPALAAGKVVFCDRFEDSTFAYQGGGRSLPLARIQELSQWVALERQPDLTLWLDLPPAIGSARIQARRPDRLEQESLDFFARAREVFAERALQCPQRVHRIDALQPAATVAAAAEAVLRDRLCAVPR